MNQFNKTPMNHREFLHSSVKRLKDDPRILGVAAGGSLILNTMDEFSDLDLVIVVDPDKYQEVLKERKEIAANIGELLESFTGEHVGESRLLICLYYPSLLHVDLKFVSLVDINDRVEDSIVIWERDLLLSSELTKGTANFPLPDLDWIENRFWIWIHYTAGKIARGELFESIDALSFLRSQVLGPMILYNVGARPQGVRKIEKFAPGYKENLKKTIPQYDRLSCFLALESTIELYQSVRKELLKGKESTENHKLITEVKKYLQTIGQSIKDGKK